jgi:hypothetical protein
MDIPNAVMWDIVHCAGRCAPFSKQVLRSATAVDLVRWKLACVAKPAPRDLLDDCSEDRSLNGMRVFAAAEDAGLCRYDWAAALQRCVADDLASVAGYVLRRVDSAGRETALEAAVAARSAGVVAALLDAGVPVSERAIMNAVCVDDSDTLAKLLARGVDALSLFPALYVAAWDGKHVAAKALVERGATLGVAIDFVLAVHVAADVEMAAILEDAGSFPINIARRWTAAIQQRDSVGLAWLVADADVDMRESMLKRALVHDDTWVSRVVLAFLPTDV